MFKRLLLLVILCPFTLLFAQNTGEDMFRGFPGTMVIYDNHADSTRFYNTERARQRYTPFSTFKIPNSLIALETGVISGPDVAFDWDRTKYPPEDWWPQTWRQKEKHTLRSAIKNSVVPFYRQVATNTGTERMQEFLNRFDYGNKDISSGLDNFWLNGSLQISAVEQIAFLKKFYFEQLGISPETTAAVKDILVNEKTDTFTLSAKTGAGYLDTARTRALGWFVGYVVRDTSVFFFALNIEGESFEVVLQPRIQIARDILKLNGIID